MLKLFDKAVQKLFDKALGCDFQMIVCSLLYTQQANSLNVQSLMLLTFNLVKMNVKNVFYIVLLLSLSQDVTLICS